LSSATDFKGDTWIMLGHSVESQLDLVLKSLFIRDW
jgi:hypothetical protein